MEQSNTKVTQTEKPVKTSATSDAKPLRVGTGLPGPGRPKKADEQEVRRLALGALKKVYGSHEKAFQALASSKEPALKRLAFEYAFGKPADKIESVNGIPFSQLNVQIIATPKNQTDGSSNDDSIPASTEQQ
jgi:hypothetical protein